MSMLLRCPMPNFSDDRARVGRPPKDELAERRKEAKFTPTEWDSLMKALKPGQKPATFIHDVTMRAISGDPVIGGLSKAMQGTRSYRGKFLTKAPAGPWEEALEHAGYFTISEDTANEMEVRDGDVFVRVIGESMEGAGIPDGSLLLMRPLEGRPARRNEIVLVEVEDANRDYFGTIKRWQPGVVPSLTNGDGNEFELPESTVNIRAVASFRGMILRNA